MEFGQELKKKLSYAAKAVSRGASRLTAEAGQRINTAVASKRVDDAMKKLGRLRYDELTHGADDASPAENAVIAEIEALISDLEKLKNRGADDSASRVCRRCRFCGTVISDDAIYCSKCGGKQE